MAGKVLALVLVALVSFSAAAPNSGPDDVVIQCPILGQVYKECGSACPPTCDNLNPICPLVCVPGCQCPQGTVLHNNRCVKPTACIAIEPPEIICPIRGQVYTDCGSACPPTCENQNPICTKQCVPGCQCPGGTVLSGDRCVKPQHCLIDLPHIFCPIPGQVFNSCGTACPPTCEVPNPICTRQCVPGCQCPSSKVLHEGRCIPLSSCSNN